ncbi:hypothetical protein FRACYDRAFT_241341 [Fragilariopsis cylindrus CCMP1102]|uniref:J domain-containing protein n=1 Tax=Fragilariopsis cylindrus CCMP1102 TaxID=635003 RepID=A0A1E7F9F8_9STRA|nr:hypothetical protein FRACYDRAFT_241341 [Fragilariopsis cylindrus CCMP1102]|eukprot:OEU14787.1 hypothetical protein FRACYDRAFT_241341 [Fragilariopsis cylindrus CCMP1102]
MELRSKTMTSPLTAGVKSSKRKHEGDASSHDSYNNNERKKETAKNSPSTSTSNSSNEDKKRKIGDDDRNPAAAAAAATGTAVLGAVSSLSATASPVTSTPVKPTNAFGTSGTFGSSTPSSIGGFAGLSSGGGAFGSSNTPSPGGSAFGSSPFIAFSKSSTPASTVGGFSVKPLFGQASAPPTSTSEPTTVSGKPAAAAAATGTASSKGIGEDGNNNKEKETIAAFKEFVKNFGRKKKPTSPTKGFNFGFGPALLPVHYKTLEMVDDDGNYLDNNPREIYVKKFKRLCLIHHPDKNNGKDRKFKELNNARHAIREYYDFTWH